MRVKTRSEACRRLKFRTGSGAHHESRTGHRQKVKRQLAKEISDVRS